MMKTDQWLFKNLTVVAKNKSNTRHSRSYSRYRQVCFFSDGWYHSTSFSTMGGIVPITKQRFMAWKIFQILFHSRRNQHCKRELFTKIAFTEIKPVFVCIALRIVLLRFKIMTTMSETQERIQTDILRLPSISMSMKGTMSKFFKVRTWFWRCIQ